MASYNANTNWDNESKYLDSLIAKGGGNAEWAKKQKSELNAAKQQYSSASASGTSGTASQKVSSGSGSYAASSDSAASRTAAGSGNSYAAASGSTKSASGGSGYNANTNWDNEASYLNNLIAQGGGQAEWAKQQLKTLRSAQQQYTGASGTSGTTDEEAALRNRYFPGYETTPSNVNLAAGTVTAPNGDVLQLHDWSTDTTDYGAQMLNAQTIDEFREAAQARVNKANAQGIDIYGSGTARTNEDLYNEWRQKTGYAPNYGDFMYKGWGYDSTTGEEGYIQNAGQGTGYYGMDSEGHWGYYADPELTQKLANGTWDDYASSDGGYVRMDDTGQPDMTEQDLSRAGQTVILTSPKGTWRCTYNNNGYITARVRTSSSYTYGLTPAKADSDAGVSSEELLYLATGQRYTGAGSTVKNSEVTGASRADYQDAMTSRAQSGTGPVYGSTNASGTNASGTNTSGANSSGTNTSGANSSGSAPTISGITNRAPDLTSILDKWLEAAKTQAEQKVDYATTNSINELQRTLEDAQSQYQTQRNQVDADEAKASDNQALYNERAGDRGGIGSAQYDSIANTAAQNRLAVNQAQTKLSTDTARQIADLRAQGEFTKADELLQLSQTYLQQLISIQQWGAEFNLSVDEFNKQIEQWNYEYEMSVSELLGSYRGQQTLASKQYELSKAAEDFDQEYKTASLTGTFRGQATLEAQASLAEAGIALAQSGIMPSSSQLAAMKSLYGYDTSAVTSLVQTAQLAQQSQLTTSKSTGTSTTSKTTSKVNNTSSTPDYDGLFTAAKESGYPKSFISNNYKKYGFSSSSGVYNDYETWLKNQESSSSSSGGYNASYFNAAMSSLSTMLAQGKTDSAVSGIDSFWSKLSDEQKTKVQKLLSGYGLTYTEG